MQRRREHVERLLRKAAEDEVILAEVIDNKKVSDTSIGFHAQQAVEKIIKALLTSKNVSYKKSHDIGKLMKVLEDNGCPVPLEFADVENLTEYAGNFRYDDLDDEPLDRRQIRQTISGFKSWAESEIEKTSKT